MKQLCPLLRSRLQILPLLLLLIAGRAAGGTDTLDFTGRLGAIAPENILSDPGYYVWCGTGIRGEDGQYYLFYSRWKTGTAGRAPEDAPTHKDMRGWIKCCEFAAAGEQDPFKGTPSSDLQFAIRSETP